MVSTLFGIGCSSLLSLCLNLSKCLPVSRSLGTRVCQNACMLMRLFLLLFAGARGSLVLLAAGEATRQRLFVDITHQLMLVPHQIIVMSEIGTGSRRTFNMRHLLLWSYPDSIAVRKGASLATSDDPWIASQEERRKEQGGGR